MSRFTFRMILAALTIVGVAIVLLSLHGQHRIPRDTDTLPSVPTGEAPPPVTR